MEIIPKKDIMHYKLILKADYRPYGDFYMTRCYNHFDFVRLYFIILRSKIINKIKELLYKIILNQS